MLTMIWTIPILMISLLSVLLLCCCVDRVSPLGPLDPKFIRLLGFDYELSPRVPTDVVGLEGGVPGYEYRRGSVCVLVLWGLGRVPAYARSYWEVDYSLGPDRHYQGVAELVSGRFELVGSLVRMDSSFPQPGAE
jgi:hypothetical protein